MKIAKLLIVFIILFTIFDSKLFGISEVNESSDIPLEVETYLDGKNQITHPSVVSFEKEWNGYKYWMAYTPYPYANGSEENPCIAVSNDMIRWETPKGLANPIANNEELGCNELKDSHILYREDLNRLEVWYLGRISNEISQINRDENQLTLFRKCSYDGVNWSKYEMMSEVNYLSPSVIWKENKYILWQIGFDTYNTTGTIQYAESIDGVNWENLKNCSIGEKEDNIKIWHGGVTFNYEKEIYEMVYIEDGSMNSEILYTSSKDGISFEQPIQILSLSKQWNRFYRPFLLYDNNYYLLYGVITDNNEWYLSMNKGSSLTNLDKLTSMDKEQMIGINYPELNNSLFSIIKKGIHDSRNYIRYEVFVFPFIFAMLSYCFKKYSMKYFVLTQCCMILGYSWFKFGFSLDLPQIVAIIFMMTTVTLMFFGLKSYKKNF